MSNGITVAVFAKTMGAAKPLTCLAYDTSFLGMLIIAVILSSVSQPGQSGSLGQRGASCEAPHSP